MKTIQGLQVQNSTSQDQALIDKQIRNSKSYLIAVVFPLVMILQLLLVSCESDKVVESKPEGKYEEIGKDIDRVLEITKKIDSFCGK